MTPDSSASGAVVETGAALDVERAVALGQSLVGTWGSWGPNMTRDSSRVAFVSDRAGTPQLWVQDVVLDGSEPVATRILLSDDPVTAVRWSADGRWLAVSVATDGGVRQQVWVVRPDGSDARRIAGDRDTHAELGPWSRFGHRLVVTVPAREAGGQTRAFLVDPTTGTLETVAAGDLIHLLDMSAEERLIVLRDGRRGEEFCVVVDRLKDVSDTLLPHVPTGATDVAIIRPAPDGERCPLVTYLVTEAGLPRRQLVSVPIGPDDWRGEARVLAARDDAELEALDADDSGRLLLLEWNVGGRSELELMDTETQERVPIEGLPGQVAYSPVLSRDGSSVVVALEGPRRARELWHVDTGTGAWTRITTAPQILDVSLVEPTLETYAGSDGLALSGWLYRVPGRTGPGPAVLWLHGGPEGQERPTFDPQHQALVAAGIAVFAPNVRGSSGYGRAFVHADDRYGRWASFDDVLAGAEHLVALGVADPARIGVSGRSYGGYATLACLAFHPSVFAAGVSICGMSDMLTFFRDTEPWIARAAESKYGHPEHDRALLEEISPMRCVDDLVAPLLVVHGEHDTNVPIGEARQVVAALQERSRPVSYLELAGEGHEFRRQSSRRAIVEAVVRHFAATLHT